ncbi:MAG: MFS transporter, partial [Rhizomicrobium sp.]
TIGIAAPILAVVVRMVQGFSLGGEVGANTAYLLEASPANGRGLIVSWQAASQYLALIAGGMVGVFLTEVMPAAQLDAYGWRVAFLLGAAAVPFGLWLRSNLPETLHASEPVGAAPELHPSRLRLARAHWRVMLLGLVVLASQTIGWYIFIYIVTYAQATLHMTAHMGFVAATAGNVIGIPLTLAAGWMSDRYGRWPVNVWGTLLFLVLIYPVFVWIAGTRSDFALIAGMTILGGAAAIGSGAFLAALVESLPKAIRSSGFGTVYSVAIAAFGGTTQLVVTWLIHVTGSAMAPAWYLIGVTGLGLVALLLMRETAPVRLRPPVMATAAA